MKKEPKFKFSVEDYNHHIETYKYFKTYRAKVKSGINFSSRVSLDWGHESDLGLYQFFLFNDIAEAKKHFYMAGCFFEHYCILPTDFHYFKYDAVFEALLSDEPNLIKRIPTWNHPDFDLDKMSSYSIFSKGTQSVLADDTEALQSIIDWFDKKLLPKKVGNLRYEIETYL
jgi:hypothetical protein